MRAGARSWMQYRSEVRAPMIPIVVLQLDALGDSADGDDGDHFLDGVVGGADDERAVQQVHGNAMRTRVVGSPACDHTSSPTSPHTCRDWTRR